MDQPETDNRRQQCHHTYTKGPRAGQRCTTRVRAATIDGSDHDTPLCSKHVRPTCSICLDVIMAGTSVTTRCKHVFHRECLARVNGNACPNCRGPLRRVQESVPDPFEFNGINVPLEIRILRPAVDMVREANGATTTTTTTTTGTVLTELNLPSVPQPPPGTVMFVASFQRGEDPDTQSDTDGSSDSDDEREAARPREGPQGDDDRAPTYLPPHEAFHEDLRYLIGAVGGRERLISILLDYF